MNFPPDESVAPRGTIRQQITMQLRREPMTALEISQAVRIPEKEVYRHLSHIQKSVAGKGQKLSFSPCRCVVCGYTFKDRRRLTRPGRCPRCRESRIAYPVFCIEEGRQTPKKQS